ncbi:hypothetical protein [Synechococcus sp. WH 8020]|uniref:hypothetical protein n=1 Tax=Synechococcus sp. (strain WH8020) TaxID=32052 RepID=UPI0012ED1603|nr:hypothetical protein [Synechococcus sp. WH 8020]
MSRTLQPVSDTGSSSPTQTALRIDSSLCGVQQTALIATEIPLRDAVFVLLRVAVGLESECSGKDQYEQTGDSNDSQRACVFGWFVHQSIPSITSSPRLIGVTSPIRVKITT